MTTFHRIGEQFPKAGKPLFIHTQFPRDNDPRLGNRLSRAYLDHQGSYVITTEHNGSWTLESSHTVIRWHYLMPT